VNSVLSLKKGLIRWEWKERRRESLFVFVFLGCCDGKFLYKDENRIEVERECGARQKVKDWSCERAKKKNVTVDSDMTATCHRVYLFQTRHFYFFFHLIFSYKLFKIDRNKNDKFTNKITSSNNFFFFIERHLII